MNTYSNKKNNNINRKENLLERYLKKEKNIYIILRLFIIICEYYR